MNNAKDLIFDFDAFTGGLSDSDQSSVFMSKSYKQFLDELRDSGETNMFGATAYLMEEFGLTRHAATEVVSAWMKEYKK